LGEFAAKHPSIRLNLRAGIWPDVIRAVEKGEADVGLVSYAEDAPRSPHLEYELLFHLHFTLLVKADHPLAKQRRIHARDLVAYPLIMSAKETFSHRTLESILRRHDLLNQVHVVMESPNTDMTRRYVALGLGIALNYMGGEPEPTTPGVVQKIFDPKLEPLPVYLVVRKGAHLPEAVQEFRAIVRRALS
jgi:DNA-binding transcriptional LysR family regulator